jgi:hypothetical protein
MQKKMWSLIASYFYAVLFLTTFMNPVSFQNLKYIIIYVVHVSGWRFCDRFPVVSLDFSVTYSFRPCHGPGVDSAPSENEYQEHFLGVKAAGAWGWQPHHLNVPNVMEICEPKLPGTLWATPGLLRSSLRVSEYAVAQLVAALRYKPAGRWFKPDGAIGICHWLNPCDLSWALVSIHLLTEMSISWEIKVASA